ncbi:MAG: amidohydrolase [Roseobacter sp.]
MKIDAHQHFWALKRGDYGWLTPNLTPLYRDFEPEDLRPCLLANHIDGTVLVQAAPTLAETEYMLGLADAHDMILGVVGWSDFEASDAAETINALAARPKLVGLRPMIQDIADDDWMLRADLAPAFETMVNTGLVFDALTMPRHLPNLSELLARYPDLRIVVDHGSKPDIANRAFESWAADMVKLATQTGAYVKLSGLVTEAAPFWSDDDLKPYIDHLIAHFGPHRMIWGSDWPVCTLASSYQRWVETTETLLIGLSASEKAAVLGENAATLYRLGQVKQ